MSKTPSPPASRCGQQSSDNLAALKYAYARWSETKGASTDSFVEMFKDRLDRQSMLGPDLPDDPAAHPVSEAEARDYFRVVGCDWQMVAFSADRFITDNDDIVMFGRCHWRHRRTGREVDSPKVDVWHFEDGKAVSFIEMFNSLAFIRAVEP